MNKKIKVKNNKKRGFTLVETLVSISILVTALAGPMTIAARSIAAANYAESQITAFFLAEEAVESVRNIRDNNALSGVDWMTDLGACIGQKCSVDALILKTITCPGGICPVLNYNKVSGLFGYTIGVGWEPTLFTREVIINELFADREVEISVTILWSNRSLNRSFIVSENLFNWQS